MVSNAQYLDDLRYLAANSFPENRALFEGCLRDAAALLIGLFSGPVCPPPVVNDDALSVTAPAESGQGAGSYFLRLNGNELAISLIRLRSSSVNGRFGLRTSRITHASASTVRPAPTDIPSSVAPIPLLLWSL